MSEPWIRIRETAAHVGMPRSTWLEIVDRENVPHIVASGGNGKRRILLFRISEVDKWLETRRARQVQATIDGARFTSRRRAS